MADTMHIVYCGDRDYVPMLGISMTSVIWSNLDSRLVFHLLLDGVHDRDLRLLQDFSRMYRNVDEVKLHYIDAECPEMKVFAGVRSEYALPVNYRLLLPRILDDEVTKALYLDGDIICRGSLAALWQTDMTGMLAAGVTDPLEKMHLRRTGLKSYVNSGVLLMNLARWREQDILPELMAFYEGKEHLGFPDQDAINTVCAGKIRSLPQKWNYPVSCNFTAPGRRNDIAPEAVLCHFL